MGCLLVIAAGAGAGYLQARKLSMRVRFLEQYLKWVSQMETEIRYGTDGISRLLDRHKKELPALSFLSQCVKRMEEGAPFPEAWRKAIQGISKEYGLKPDDLEAVQAFGNGLGASDVDGQTAHCRMHQKLLQSRLKGAQEEKQKKGKLYFMLGLCLGVSVALLIA